MSAPAGAGRSDPLRLAVFVSPHGFGHAARTSAVLAALRDLRPDLEVTLYTTAPRWFFEESLSFAFSCRDVACDVGLVQSTALDEDLGATVDRLDRFWTETKSFRSRELVSEVRDSGAAAVLCDISPMGLAVAREAGLPAILIENFTWDWIYEPLAEREPRFAPWVGRMRELFALADLRIRCEPFCDSGDAAAEPGLQGDAGDPADSREAPAASGTAANPTPPSTASFPGAGPGGASSIPGAPDRAHRSLPEKLFQKGPDHVEVAPVARRPRSGAAEVRARLGFGPPASGRPLVLLSMGGIRWSYSNLDRLRAAGEYDFVVPGGAERESRAGNLALLPHHSPVHHPDLVAAADVVVGKLGYSTVAEAVCAGARCLYPPRAAFREHAVLARYVEARLPSAEIGLAELDSGAWLARLPALLERPRPAGLGYDGARSAAAAILARIGGA